VDGFRLGPDPGPLVPPFLALTGRRWISVASDVRLTGLGWTEVLVLEHGLATPHWAVEARWAPPVLSSSPAAVGLGGPVVTDGAEGAAVAAPRGAWRVAGLVGGPVVTGRLGAVLSLEATGVELPAPEPGLAGGGRARQSLALSTTWHPSAGDHLSLLVLAGRRTESPDCYRCTAAAARLDAELAGLVGLSWTHTLAPGAGLTLGVSAEQRIRSAAAVTQPPGPSHLDLSSWITDGAPGSLSPEDPASIAAGSRTRLQLASSVHATAGRHRLEGGVEARLDIETAERSVPGSLRFLDRGAPCGDGSSDCAFRVEVAPTRTETRGLALAVRAEDAFRLGDLGIRAGLRLDAAQAAAADASTGLRLGLGPRLALAWDVAGEGRQWILLHAGRSHDVELHDALARSQLPLQRVAGWTGGAFDDCVGRGPTCVQLGGPATLAPGGLPWTDEVALGWRGRPGWWLEGGVEARWRQSGDLWAEQETGLLTDERGRWTSPEGEWQSRRVVSTDRRAWRRALGVSAWVHARAGPARISATWSAARVTGTAAGPFDPWLADPRTAALAEGPLPDDQRHRLRLSLAVTLHPAVELGVRLRYASGGPLWETFSVPDSAGLRTVRDVRGMGVLGARPVALRDPDVLTADAWIRIHVGALWTTGAPRLDLTLEAAQVAGGNTPVHLSASSGRLGAVLRREPPFQVVLGLRAGD
ncbi:MAG: hypothetical protein ACXWK9_03230, partial [Myxococcaceae bacterium]